MRKYSPIITTDKILIEILEALERIESKLGAPQKPAAPQKPIETKICKACGGTHPRAIDYATCARMKKREVSK